MKQCKDQNTCLYIIFKTSMHLKIKKPGRILQPNLYWSREREMRFFAEIFSPKPNAQLILRFLALIIIRKKGKSL